MDCVGQYSAFASGKGRSLPCDASLRPSRCAHLVVPAVEAVEPCGTTKLSVEPSSAGKNFGAPGSPGSSPGSEMNEQDRSGPAGFAHGPTAMEPTAVVIRHALTVWLTGHHARRLLICFTLHSLRAVRAHAGSETGAQRAEAR